MNEKIDFVKLFKNSRLFRKFKKPKFFKISFLWEWTDIGLCLRIFNQLEFTYYHIGIDIQILWLNIWIQLFRKNIHND